MIAPHFDGHHFPYLEHFAAGALARGIDVVVATGDDAAQGRRTVAALHARFGAQVAVVTAPLPRMRVQGPRVLALVLGELQRRAFLRTVYRRARRQHRVDHVFLPYLDWTLFAIAVLGSPFGSTSYSGITMRQRFHLARMGVSVARERMNLIKERLFRRLLRGRALSTLYTNDETLAEYFQGSAFAGKVVHIPDPSDPQDTLSRADARRQLGLPMESCVVLVYGFLDHRKGVPALVAWLAERFDAGAPVYLLAVGQQGPEIAALWSEAPAARLVAAGRVKMIDAFVPEEDESLYFGACDVVWLGYERFEMMSGVLVKTAQHGRIALFREYGLIDHYAKRHGAPVPAGCCSGALAALPVGFAARTFERRQGAPPLPDHSWSNTLQLVYR